MGRQSARLWFDGHDHKDIYFDGHYHKQMYLSDENAHLTLLWEKLKEVNVFRFVANATRYTLVFKAKGNITIDWGESGAVETYNLSNLSIISHSYNDGYYVTVSISGNLEDISFEQCYALHQILTPFPESMYEKEDFSLCFYNSHLQFIPSNLFINCRKAKNFWACFSTSKLYEIPKGLLDNCHEADNFWGCFARTPIKSIPEGLFDYCTKATNFQACFHTGYRFDGIEEIPSGLFDKCLLITNVSSCFKGTQITKIPKGLFDYNLQITNFSETFYNCENIVGEVPELWKRENVTEYGGCFFGCTKAENYEDIPNDWKSAT